MKKHTINILVALLLIVGIGSLTYWQKQQSLLVNAVHTGNQDSVSANTSKTETLNTDIQSVDTNEDSTKPTSVTQTNDSPISEPAPVTHMPMMVQKYTSTEVAQHNSKTSCWSIINDGVYDLTSWVPNHPGGEKAILGICGIDGSSKFNKIHGGKPQQAKILVGFKIGIVG